VWLSSRGVVGKLAYMVVIVAVKWIDEARTVRFNGLTFRYNPKQNWTAFIDV
jgi:hypothetical protein